MDRGLVFGEFEKGFHKASKAVAEIRAVVREKGKVTFSEVKTIVEKHNTDYNWVMNLIRLMPECWVDEGVQEIRCR